ncbi:hypothetical protein FXW78_25585 [Rhodococcus opacus]|nr:hypothetical protein [Rhodococcus opacus]
MSLYRNVANKEDMLDGIVDVVFGEIDLPTIGSDWKAAMKAGPRRSVRRPTPPRVRRWRPPRVRRRVLPVT